MMADPFRLLTAGVSFKRSDLKTHGQAFSTSKSSQPAAPKSAALDFFGSAAVSSATPSESEAAASTSSSKKAKKRKASTAELDAVPSSIPSLPPLSPEEVASLLKRHKIKTTTTIGSAPVPLATFDDLRDVALKLARRTGKKNGERMGRDEAAVVQKVQVVLETLAKMGFEEMTGVQMMAPAVILDDRDLLACAPTGSGKTAAFLLPVLIAQISTICLARAGNTPQPRSGPTQRKKRRKTSEPAAVEDSTTQSGPSPRALIVEPTRELARQVYSEAKRLGEGTGWKVGLWGEGEEGDNVNETSGDVDVVISTPLRIVHAVKEGKLDLSRIEHLVLDEADQQFDLGFLPQTDEIIAACKGITTSTSKSGDESESDDSSDGGAKQAQPVSRALPLRMAMFSATVPSSVEEMARSVMGGDVVRVIVGQKDTPVARITQSLSFVGSEDGKLSHLLDLFRTGGLSSPLLLFVQSIARAEELYSRILQETLDAAASESRGTGLALLAGGRVGVLHSERSKNERDSTVARFAEGKIWVLVCTDVMARGVDFRGVETVVNYDFPQSTQSYIHRIGRSGRSTRSGRAITFFTHEDAPHLRLIVNIMRNSGCDVPEWMLELRAPNQNERQNLKRKPVDREQVGGDIGGRGLESKKAKYKKGGKVGKVDGKGIGSVKRTRRQEKKLESGNSDNDESES